ncbi:MAG: VWA domain-containing protein [Candidatus Obscuribacterales bacterium]
MSAPLIKIPEATSIVFTLTLLLAGQFSLGVSLELGLPAAAKDIELLRLVPTLDKLPERRLLKGSIGQDQGPEGIPVNIFGYSEVVSKDGKGGAASVQIGYVKPYTAAWRSGLSAGDKVLATKVQLPQALLTIERGGKRYGCLMETKQTLPIALSGKATENKSDAQILSEYAIVMLIDSSASMQTADCPGNISRWQWCKEHMKDLYVANFTSNLGSLRNQSNVSIITFDSNYRSHRNCSTAQLPQIFQDNEPSGETFMAPALTEAFALVRNQLNYGKPAMITVVSDGRLNDAESLKKAIIAQVNSLSKPELLSIVFLEVGTPDKLLKQLDNELVKQGAKADIVTVVPFSQATSQGLVHSLAATVPKPKPVETTIKGAVSTAENKAKAAISAHIILPSKPTPHQPAPLIQPKTIVQPQGRPKPQPPIKAHPTGTSLEAKAKALPQEIDEKEQVLKRNANRTYP